MATLPLDPAYRRVSVAEFLEMDFRDAKAELVDGMIFMMPGGMEEHARIAGNIYFALRLRLRGSGCLPYNSDFAVRTGPGTVRFPDVSVYCNDPGAPENARRQLLGDPVVVVEVLSPSTASLDQVAKLSEYAGLPGTRDILFVDPATERVRHVRSGGADDGWLPAGSDVDLASLGVILPHAEIFARD